MFPATWIRNLRRTTTVSATCRMWSRPTSRRTVEPSARLRRRRTAAVAAAWLPPSGCSCSSPNVDDWTKSCCLWILLWKLREFLVIPRVRISSTSIRVDLNRMNMHIANASDRNTVGKYSLLHRQPVVIFCQTYVKNCDHGMVAIHSQFCMHLRAMHVKYLPPNLIIWRFMSSSSSSSSS